MSPRCVGEPDMICVPKELSVTGLMAKRSILMHVTEEQSVPRL